MVPNIIYESDSTASSYPSYDSCESRISLVQGSVSSSTESSSQKLGDKKAKLPQLRARGTRDPKALWRVGNELFHRGDLEGAIVMTRADKG